MRHNQRSLLGLLTALSLVGGLASAGCSDSSKATDDAHSANQGGDDTLSPQEDQSTDQFYYMTSDSISAQEDTGSSDPWEEEFYYDTVSDSAAAPEPEPEQNTELYGKYVENNFIETSQEPTSTFSVDVDTASYSNARRFLNKSQLPPEDSIRVEEFINYFRYDYPQPDEHPFSVNMEVAPSPFGEGLHLMRIGLQGKIIPEEERIPANLIFLIDVSGSMEDSNKLPLVKFLLAKLVTVLRSDDRLGIVVYAGHQGTLLESTAVENKSAILDAIDGLSAGGSTAGAAGLEAAYKMASAHMMDGGINRVIICTDGDFNVGTTGDALIEMIETYRDSGVTLSVFGFGTGNYNDLYMEQLADHGNGNYAYIDSQNEALHIIGEKLVATLQVIAKDVKVQIEFNPANVLKYRLVGYENRLLENQDFNDDTVDAAEVGAGHTVTAFYEVQLAPEPGLDQLAECRFRYKLPEEDTSILITQTLMPEAVESSFEVATPGFRLAAAIAEFAEILRHSKHSEGTDFDQVASIAASAANTDRPEEAELLELIDKADMLWPDAE